MKNNSRYAAIDIGSNSVKFIIAEYANGELKVLLEESHTTRLAGDLIRSGRLSEEAMERTVDVLRRIRKLIEEYQVVQKDAVATSAVRDSDNRKEFLSRAREALGFSVKLYSGEEEAETVFAGVSNDSFFDGKEIFVIDIGGGSAEWIQGLNKKIGRRISLPLGCVRLRERFIKAYPVSEECVQAMRSTLAESLRSALNGFALENRTLVGTGGTATCLSAIEQVIPDFNPALVDHFTLSIKDIENMLNRLSRCTIDQLREIPGLPPKRSDLIVPGAALLLESMRYLGAKEITASVRGLRYGVLMRMIQGVQ